MSSSLSEEIDSFLRAAAETPLVSVPGRFTGTARYQLVDRIAEGASGFVYEAIDHRFGDRVALKVLRRSTRGLVRFKGEFRSLADLDHPNLVRFYELFSAGPHWVLAMELVEGRPFVEAVRADPHRLHASILQLTEGLYALHAAGKLHCDLKPANVLVCEDGRVVLLDFGLSIERDLEQPDSFAGTPRYMSPEQAAGAPLGEASDWYAVGIMLYEALAGRLPFDGSETEVLAAKREREPAPLADGGELASLCAALLRRDPRARPTGAEVLRRLGGEVPAAAPAPTVPAPDGLPAELGSLLLVGGPPASGKSAAVGRFAAERRPEAWVLAGRARENESLPWKGLDAAVDELARLLIGFSDERVEALLPPDTAAMARWFPALKEVPSVRSRPQPSGMALVEERARAMAALRQLVHRLAEEQPLWLCVDDLHCADAESAALVAELMRPPAPRIGFVGTYCTGERSAFLTRLAELRRSLLAEVATREIDLGPGLPPPLARLDEPALRLLEVLALLEAPLDASVAAATAGVPGRAAFLALRSTHMVRGEGPYTIHDEGVRAAVLEGMPGERRRALHRRIAGALGDADATETLRHLEQAGAPADELRHWRRRAAEASAGAGRPIEAAARYRLAAAGAAPAEALDLERLAAQELLRGGRIQEALALVDEKAPQPSRPRGRVKLPRTFRAAAELSPLVMAQIDLLHTAALAWARVDPERAVGLAAAATGMALDEREPQRLARALALEGWLAALEGDAADHLFDLAARIEHPETHARLTLSRALAAYSHGAWHEARVHFEEAERLAPRQMQWELEVARPQALDNLFFLGELPALVRRRGALTALIQDHPAGAPEELSFEAALYSGDAAGALARLAVQTTHPWRIDRIRHRDAEGRAALADRLGERARGCAMQLLREELPPAKWLGTLLLAGTAALDGEPDRAATLYAQAADGFDGAGMALHATVARVRLGQRDEGERWLATRGVRHPQRFAALWAPVISP